MINGEEKLVANITHEFYEFLNQEDVTEPFPFQESTETRVDVDESKTVPGH